MKNIMICITCVCIALLSACGNDKEPEINGTKNTIDSLKTEVHKIDSILFCGKLAHLDIYDIGEIKTVAISVQKVTTDNESLSVVNFRKDCGGQYFYSWEDARMLESECQYFINAIKTIRSNIKSSVEHGEQYAYVTIDDIRILAYATKGKPWKVELSVDYFKSNSTITISDQELEELIAIIQKAQQKIKEISK